MEIQWVDKKVSVRTPFLHFYLARRGRLQRLKNQQVLSEMGIRIAEVGDWESIVRIYNEAIDTRISTADTDYVSIENKENWLKEHSEERCPIYVAENNAETEGWCSLSPYRYGRSAFDKTAEISYYISETHRGKGVGTGLVERAISDCSRLGIEILVAILLGSNAPSINLLLKFGFEEWGRLPGIAEIDANRYDHLYMGKRV